MNLFFDLDGTLIDSRADLATSVNLTRADFGLPPLPQDEVVRSVGDGMIVLLERTCPELAERFTDALTVMRAHYAENLAVQTTLYPGIPDALDQLGRAGYSLAVVSNKPAVFIPPILRKLDIARFFQAVVGGGDTAELKPSPAMLRIAAERMDTRLFPEDWVIGDHQTDLAMGRAAGLRRCLCTYGFGMPGGETFDASVDEPSEIPGVIEQMKMEK